MTQQNCLFFLFFSSLFSSSFFSFPFFSSFFSFLSFFLFSSSSFFLFLLFLFLLLPFPAYKTPSLPTSGARVLAHFVRPCLALPYIVIFSSLPSPFSTSLTASWWVFSSSTSICSLFYFSSFSSFRTVATKRIMYCRTVCMFNVHPSLPLLSSG